jgi:hypothetical protein
MSTSAGKTQTETVGLKANPTTVNVRPIHRIVATIIMAFTLYIGTTGLMIQSVDLRAIASHAAATDPEMMAIRESLDGTGNFAVIQPTDYAAAALPDGFDFNAAMSTLLKSVRSSTGDSAPLKYLELRVIDGKPIGLVQAGGNNNAGGNNGGNNNVGGNNGGGGGGNGGGANNGNILVRVDLVTGLLLPNPPPRPRGRPAQSMHNVFKKWHRLQFLSGYFGDLSGVLNALIAIGLGMMVVTGVVLYFQLLCARRRAGLNAIFWSAGSWWRSLHRWVAVVAAIFLLVVSISGTLLSIDTVALGIYGATHTNAGRYARFPYGMTADLSSPLPDSKIPAMLVTTLSAYHAAEGNTPIKVLRLRYFSGMPQGVILTGGDDTRQLVYNAETGKTAHMTESSYPYQGFPFGWREHEYMKQIHRGDALGIPGRLMDVFAGLSMVFLSASGLYMYVDLLRRRRRGGRKQLFWV